MIPPAYGISVGPGHVATSHSRPLTERRRTVSEHRNTLSAPYESGMTPIVESSRAGSLAKLVDDDVLLAYILLTAMWLFA